MNTQHTLEVNTVPILKKSTLLIGAVCIAAAIWLAFILLRPGAGNSDTNNVALTQPKPANSVSTAPAASNLPPSSSFSGAKSSAAANGISGTYQPGVGRSIRIADGMRVKNDKSVGWWLYARSAEEASWMDHFGYPTPAEELQLLKMSDADLAALAKSGDKNAEIHIYARLASAAFVSRDENNVKKSAGFLAFLARDNPYGATKAMVVYGDLVRSYYDIPESTRTEADKKRLQIYWDMYLVATQTSALFGDHAAKSTGNSIGLIPYQDDKTGLSYGETVASGFAQSSRERIKQGLPPLTILPRPTVQGVTDQRVYEFDPAKVPVLERY